MGWYGCSSWTGPKDIQREKIEEITRAGHKILMVKATSYGRHIWIAIERKSGEKYIAYYKVEGKAPNLAYKPMSEDMGPVDVDCPMELLNVVPEPINEHAKDWRARVIAYHNRRAQKFSVGDEVTVYGKKYTIVKPHKRSYIIRAEDGRIYRGQPSKMVKVDG